MNHMCRVDVMQRTCLLCIAKRDLSTHTEAGLHVLSRRRLVLHRLHNAHGKLVCLCNHITRVLPGAALLERCSVLQNH